MLLTRDGTARLPHMRMEPTVSNMINLRQWLPHKALKRLECVRHWNLLNNTSERPWSYWWIAQLKHPSMDLEHKICNVSLKPRETCPNLTKIPGLEASSADQEQLLSPPPPPTWPNNPKINLRSCASSKTNKMQWTSAHHCPQLSRLTNKLVSVWQPEICCRGTLILQRMLCRLRSSN